jgi:putative ABC transport system substrate-binding protein
MTIHKMLTFAAGIVLLLGLIAPCCRAADIVVVADTRLKPVNEILSGMRKSVNASIRIFDPDEVKGRLREVVEKEGGRVVVALSREALDEALRLPPAIPVIYDLVVTPPVISRPNTTGFYLATPVREYNALLRNHLRSIRQIAVVGSRSQLSTLAWSDEQSPSWSAYSVRSSAELVDTVRQLDTAGAILLLPDASLLTSATLDEAYLISFRKGIPILGISERNVREGALAALVVDMVNVGKLIGGAVAKALKGESIDRVPPSPPRKFDLYLNTTTARKMGIPIPGEVLRMAKKVYP